jgi:hypothetical protein
MLKLALAITLALFAAPSLTGCQHTAPVLAPVSPAIASEVQFQGQPLKAPRLIDAAQVRRVFQASGDGLTLFGINFSMSYFRETRKGPDYERWSSSHSFAGRGVLTKASHNRLVYQVPDDQVLILNQSEGKGSINLNGYRFDVSSQIAYMFGAGELVVFTFQPTQTYASSGRDTTSISYSSLGISGYVGSPEMIGRVMGGKGK